MAQSKAVDDSHDVEAYIGLGSNLDDPCRQLKSAVEEIGAVEGIRLLNCSPIYETAPVGGPADQPNYLNAVVKIATKLDPKSLLSCLQEIELVHGRIREERWGARTLDLDILLYGQRELDHPGLTIPHPRMHQRAFVLIPLRDIVPDDFLLPGLGRLAELIALVGTDGVELSDC